VLAVGSTGSGKSHLVRALLLGRPGRRLVIDPSDSTLTEIPGAVTFSDPHRATNHRGESWRQAATARFVPTDPADLDTYDAVYAWALDHAPITVWLDEGRIAMPANGTRPHALRYVMQGRKHLAGHLVATTRPIGVNVEIRSESQHLFVFRLTEHDDQVAVAKRLGLKPKDLRDALRPLDEHGFLHWCARDPYLIRRSIQGL